MSRKQEKAENSGLYTGLREEKRYSTVELRDICNKIDGLLDCVRLCATHPESEILSPHQKINYLIDIISEKVQVVEKALRNH